MQNSFGSYSFPSYLVRYSQVGFAGKAKLLPDVIHDRLEAELSPYFRHVSGFYFLEIGALGKKIVRIHHI